MAFRTEPVLIMIAFMILQCVVGINGDTLSPSSLSAAMYWKKMLPNTPMPQIIKDSLYRPDWLEQDDKSTSLLKKKHHRVYVGMRLFPNANAGYGGQTNYLSAASETQVRDKGRLFPNANAGYGAQTNYLSASSEARLFPNANAGYGAQTNYLSAASEAQLEDGERLYPNANAGYGGQTAYLSAASDAQIHSDSTATRYFFQKDLRPGSKMNLRFTQSTTKDTVPFLSRNEAALIPFSSQKFPAILDRFSLTPGSVEAKVMKQTIDECERKRSAGEDEKHCATSLESMVDFATTNLGYKVNAVVATNLLSKGATTSATLLQAYTVVSVNKVSKGENVMVACHKESYPYLVYFCHKTKNTVGYKVLLVGADGSRVEAAAACHQDTSAWNPQHLAFQVLKVKPGTVPICHFLAMDNLIWV